MANPSVANLSTGKIEEAVTPPRRTASVVSISGSPSNIDSPKSTTRKGNQSKNRLEVLENEDSGPGFSSNSLSKQPLNRRPFEYPPNLSNNESSTRSSTKSTPRTAAESTVNSSATNDFSSTPLLKSWRSDKSGALIEDEIETQKELSDRLFSLRSTCTDEIHDESLEVYEDIYSEDDLPAAELSSDDGDCCEVLENSVTHLSDDDVIDFSTTKDFMTQTTSLPTSDGDWIISSQEKPSGGSCVLEMSVLKEENSNLRIDGTPSGVQSSGEMRIGRPSYSHGGQWAGSSTKEKKKRESGDALSTSPSISSLEIAKSKIEGYTLVGHSLGNQTPNTDIRFHKQSTAGSISKSCSSKFLSRGGGTGGNSSSRRNLEISGDSIELRMTGVNTANPISRKLRDSLEMSSLSEFPSTAVTTQYHASHLVSLDGDGDDESQLEESFNGISNATLNLTAEVLDEHTAGVSKLRLSSPKCLLFSASLDGTIRIWSSKSSDLGNDTTAAKVVLDVTAFSKISNGSSGTLVRKPSGNKNTVTTSARPIRATGLWVDGSCDTIWGGYSDGVVRVWIADGRPMRALKGHDELVTCVEGCDTAVSSALGSPHVASTGSLDKTVRVWDIRAKRSQVALFRGHNDSILSMKWIDSGRSLVTASKDRSIKIWDFRSGRFDSCF